MVFGTSSSSMLGGNAERLWQGVGDFSGGVGLAFALGYDWRRLGASVGYEVAGASIADRDAGSASFSALVHWRFATPIAGHWTPRLTAGYVRQAVGGTPMAPSEIPDESILNSPVAAPGDERPRDMSIVGNGLRFGLGGERPLRGKTSLALEVGSDLVSFGHTSYDGFGYTLRDGGWSFSPRLAFGLRIRP